MWFRGDVNVPLQTPDCSMVFFLVFSPLTFQFGSCSRLNWVPVGFWLHVKHLHSDSDSLSVCVCVCVCWCIVLRVLCAGVPRQLFHWKSGLYYARVRCVIIAMFTVYFSLKPGFHYPSWRPVLTARVDVSPLPVNTGRVDWRAFPLAELTGRQHGPSTRVVETGLYCAVIACSMQRSALPSIYFALRNDFWTLSSLCKVNFYATV